MNWTEILVALIAAGLLKYLIDGLKWFSSRRKLGTPEAKAAFTLTTVDQSLTIVAKARDELEADNARLRAQMAEADARHATEMARRDAREAGLHEEILRLETKVREILAEVESLKFRHTDTGPMPRVRP